MYVKKVVSIERTPYMYVRSALVTICYAVCYAFTGKFCWRCQVIHQAMVRGCHVEKSKEKSIKVALRACSTNAFFENVLRILNFLTLYFSGGRTVKMPRGNYLDRELPELVPLWREMLRTMLSRSFLTVKMRIMMFKLKYALTTLMMLLLICQAPLISWFQRIESVLQNPCSCGRKH